MVGNAPVLALTLSNLSEDTNGSTNGDEKSEKGLQSSIWWNLPTDSLDDLQTVTSTKSDKLDKFKKFKSNSEVVRSRALNMVAHVDPIDFQ